MAGEMGLNPRTSDIIKDCMRRKNDHQKLDRVELTKNPLNNDQIRVICNLFIKLNCYNKKVCKELYKSFSRVAQVARPFLCTHHGQGTILYPTWISLHFLPLLVGKTILPWRWVESDARFQSW